MNNKELLAAIKVYTASKTKHAQKWLQLRASGVNVISTWIYEAGEGQSVDLKDLGLRCLDEAANCDVMIVYGEEGDYQKGAFIEMGAALAHNKPIYLIGSVLPNGSVFTHLPNVKQVATVEEALATAINNLQEKEGEVSTVIVQQLNKTQEIDHQTDNPTSTKSAVKLHQKAEGEESAEEFAEKVYLPSCPQKDFLIPAWVYHFAEQYASSLTQRPTGESAEAEWNPMLIFTVHKRKGFRTCM